MNVTDTLVFTSIRNMKDLSAFIEESSALVPEERLMEIYKKAKRTSPYAFLWLKQQGLAVPAVNPICSSAARYVSSQIMPASRVP